MSAKLRCGREGRKHSPVTDSDAEAPGEPWRPSPAYRCYLHGPDGIHALRSHGPGASGTYVRRPTGSNPAARPRGSVPIGLKRVRNVIHRGRTAGTRNDRQEIEPVLVPEGGMPANPTGRRPRQPGALRRPDGLLRGFGTGATGSHLDEDDRVRVHRHDIDLEPAGSPVPREDAKAAIPKVPNRDDLPGPPRVRPAPPLEGHLLRARESNPLQGSAACDRQDRPRRLVPPPHQIVTGPR